MTVCSTNSAVRTWAVQRSSMAPSVRSLASTQKTPAPKAAGTVSEARAPPFPWLMANVASAIPASAT